MTEVAVVDDGVVDAFLFDGHRILIRTGIGIGSKLEAATQNAVVAFEVDDFDPMYHSGWSVVVTGVASEITDPDELSELRRAPIARWAPDGDGRIVSIATELVSGRRIGAPVAAPAMVIRGGARR